MAYLDLIMLYFQILILLLKSKCEIIIEYNERFDKYSKSSWKCTQMDEALVNFQYDNKLNDNNNNNNLIVNYQYTECNKCPLINLVNLTSESNFMNNKILDSYYSYYISIVTVNNEIVCPLEVHQFSECGNYLFDVNKCNLKLLNKLPFNSNNYIYISIVIAVLSVFLYNLIVYLLKKFRKNKVKIEESMELKDENQKVDKKPAKAKRLLSLDTFRGLSLVLMIFVNYGSGGYKQLQHKPWHGITIADFVFPWFLFIMGVSLVISTNVLLQKQNKSKINVLIKILIRSIKLFFIGIMLNSRFGVYLSQLRIFGVLQRISLCYLFVGIVEVIFFRKEVNANNEPIGKYKSYFIDLIKSWTHWLVMVVVITIWFLLTYLLPIPDCPKGYLGPGGLDSNLQFKNCTGGAAGYIDRLLIGDNHLYSRPTCMKIYQTTQPFDPEGIMGIFNSILLTYFGAQAGRIIIYHKNDINRLVLWFIWCLFTFVLFGAFTFFDLENGPIPVNKNLWTLTFTLVTACSSYFILLILYFIIDMKNWWNGAPIIYPGMNSIIIYFFHLVFRTTFPSQWLVSNTHVAQLFLNLWGCFFWTGIATYLYYKNLFYNL